MTDDRVFLEYILECIAGVEELTINGRGTFEAAKHDRAAVLYYLQTLAESTQRLTEQSKATHPEINWVAISGFRNRLVHGYLEVNLNLVWNVITNDLPPLKAAVLAILETLDLPDDED